MPHVVTDRCKNCDYPPCADVCPMGAICRGPGRMVINQNVCIDCGVCVGECAAQAIVTDNTEEGQKWIEFNRKHAKADT